MTEMTVESIAVIALIVVVVSLSFLVREFVKDIRRERALFRAYEKMNRLFLRQVADGLRRMDEERKIAARRDELQREQAQRRDGE